MINPVNAYERIKKDFDKLEISEATKTLLKATVMTCLIDEMDFQMDQDFAEKKRALIIETKIK